MVRKDFLPDQSSPDDEKDADFEKCFVKILYVATDLKWFTICFSELIKRQFGIKLKSTFCCLKCILLFSTKSNTPHALRSNVPSEFTCS